MITIIDPEHEVKAITAFLTRTLREQNVQTLLVGVSGGIDSAVTLALATKAVGVENVRALLLPYRQLNQAGLTNGKMITDFFQISSNHSEIVNIGDMTDEVAEGLALPSDDQTRMGNIMARMRMVALFDRAKKHNALVCGTENRSEYLLGYYTRFGDEASDIEPIRHLYKTQVYQLAAYLQLPETIITQEPTAGLWEDQTDEKQFGFTYKEADQVLYGYYEMHKSLEELVSLGFTNAGKIISWTKSQAFKHHVPYTLSGTEAEE